MNTELIWSAAQGDLGDQRYCVMVLQLLAAKIITEAEARSLLLPDDE